MSAALGNGAELNRQPLSVPGLDAGGHQLAFQRQDGASTLRAAIATGKAAGALALGISSRRIGEMAAERPSFIASLGPISPTGIVPAAGGVIVIGDDGAPIGAVGITGDTPTNEKICPIPGKTESRLVGEGGV